ncbi:hypothetical protein ACLB2K_032576 [Fragaria x ananassa]
MARNKSSLIKQINPRHHRLPHRPLRLPQHLPLPRPPLLLHHLRLPTQPHPLRLRRRPRRRQGLPPRPPHALHLRHHRAALARKRRPPRRRRVVAQVPRPPAHGGWYLFKDLHKPESDRVGSPVARVLDPEEADLFYVPFFSSLSLIVNTNRQAAGSGERPAVAYRDEENQEALMEWLEEEQWTRSFLLVCDFGRLKPDQGSLVKDVIVPYSHRINTYTGDISVENRNTLLFFMGNRFRKEGGKIRDFLFQLLENEEDVIVKHGTQSRESRRAATHGMHTSKFCLNPAGDTPSACRLFDSLVSLCVPVIISDSIELPFETVVDYRKIAIFVESNTALRPGFLVSMLREITSERILEYQKELNEVKHCFQYGVPNGSVNEIWRQVAQKLPFIKLSINRDKCLVKRDLNVPDCSCVCSNQTGIINSL